MCAARVQQVDNHPSSTDDKMTGVKDVSDQLLVAYKQTLVQPRVKRPYPQSTALITVIKNMYRHPPITMGTS